MGWTMTAGTGKSGGSWPSSTDSALGPPVDAPIATMSIGARGPAARCSRIGPSDSTGIEPELVAPRTFGWVDVRDRIATGPLGVLAAEPGAAGAAGAIGTYPRLGTDMVVASRGTPAAAAAAIV